MLLGGEKFCYYKIFHPIQVMVFRLGIKISKTIITSLRYVYIMLSTKSDNRFECSSSSRWTKNLSHT